MVKSLKQLEAEITADNIKNDFWPAIVTALSNNTLMVECLKDRVPFATGPKRADLAENCNARNLNDFFMPYFDDKGNLNVEGEKYFEIGRIWGGKERAIFQEMTKDYKCAITDKEFMFVEAIFFSTAFKHPTFLALTNLSNELQLKPGDHTDEILEVEKVKGEFLALSKKSSFELFDLYQVYRNDLKQLQEVINARNSEKHNQNDPLATQAVEIIKSIQEIRPLSHKDSRDIKDCLSKVTNLLNYTIDQRQSMGFSEATKDLIKTAQEVAPGKPSTWKKVLGGICTLAGLALGALGVALTVTGIGALPGAGLMAAGSLLATGGVTLFVKGKQQGISKQLENLAACAEQYSAKPAEMKHR